VSLASRALVAVRDQGKVRVFDGTCPHRGAHLGHGGRLIEGQRIRCPFHGKSIGLGAGNGDLSVREHDVIDCGAVVFVKLSDIPARDHGFEEAVRALLDTHALVPALTERAAVPPELIIENAFDFAHFPTVHLISRLARPRVWLGDDAELNITTAFRTRTPAWESAELDFTSHFHARAFSPNLVVTELGSTVSSNFVITGAIPAAGGYAAASPGGRPPGTPAGGYAAASPGGRPPGTPAGGCAAASPGGRPPVTPAGGGCAAGGCIARIAIAVRRTASETTASALVEGARHAFEQDQRIWDHLDLRAPVNLDAADAPVLAFRAFCSTFAAHAATRAPATRAPATTPPATRQLTPLPPATGAPSDGRAR